MPQQLWSLGATAQCPTFDRLLRALGGDADIALAEFRGRVATHGAPIAESVPDDPDHYLLSFVWRADESIDNVALIENCGGGSGRNST